MPAAITNENAAAGTRSATSSIRWVMSTSRAYGTPWWRIRPTGGDTVPSSAEDSPSGLWRSLGKRVGLTPSGVRIPYPPLNAGPALLRCRAWALSVSRDEPHGLDELQRQLRRTAPQFIERAAVPPGRKVLHVLYLLLS